MAPLTRGSGGIGGKMTREKRLGDLEKRAAVSQGPVMRYFVRFFDGDGSPVRVTENGAESSEQAIAEAEARGELVTLIDFICDGPVPGQQR